MLTECTTDRRARLEKLSAWPSTWRRHGIGLPINHILVSRSWLVLERRVHPDRMGSDHHPVIAVLVPVDDGKAAAD